MSDGPATEERRKRASKNCQHRWVIATPNGKTSRGSCKRCGATKRFPNAPEEGMWGFAAGKASTARWANRRTATPQVIRRPSRTP